MQVNESRDLSHLFPGEHDCFGEKPGHPQALRPQGERKMRPGDGDALPVGGPGPQLHVHWRLRLLPQAAGRGALWLQCPQGTVWLQVVEPGDVNQHLTADGDGSQAPIDWKKEHP